MGQFSSTTHAPSQYVIFFVNIAVDYHQMNRKIDTGKTLKRWPILVDRYNATCLILVGGEDICSSDHRVRSHLRTMINTHVAVASSMGHVWGKKLAQNNSKPTKAVIRLALMLWFLSAYNLLQRTIVL